MTEHVGEAPEDGGEVPVDDEGNLVLGSWSVDLTARGPRDQDSLPTVAEIEAAIEQAFPNLKVNARATRTDR